MHVKILLTPVERTYISNTLAIGNDTIENLYWYKEVMAKVSLNVPQNTEISDNESTEEILISLPAFKWFREQFKVVLKHPKHLVDFVFRLEYKIDKALEDTLKPPQAESGK